MLDAFYGRLYILLLSAAGEEIVVATTRIETMLGDTGVAVNPKDSRFSVSCLYEVNFSWKFSYYNIIQQEIFFKFYFLENLNPKPISCLLVASDWKA